MNNQMNFMLFAIGSNYFGEFGLGHTITSKDLTHIFNNRNIKNVYSGNQYCICRCTQNHNNSIHWVAGTNDAGQCGITNTPNSILKFKSININNTINITKVCVSAAGDSTFWISDKFKVYGNGRNNNCQLGLENRVNRHEPGYIKCLNHNNDVIDVRSAHFYSIALCKPIQIRVIHHWSVSNCNNVPSDVINLIVRFYDRKIAKVYSTPRCRFGGNGQGSGCGWSRPSKWKEINILSTKNIIRIQAGYYHSLFLASNGSVFSCGSNDKGQLGYGQGFIGKKCGQTPVPNLIIYFINQGIKIKNIKCGCLHNLCVDYNNKVYGWGCNENGQCGDGRTVNVYSPKIITSLIDYDIDGIDCGWNHSFCKTSDGKYFLFGRNVCYECVQFAVPQIKSVTIPHCINKIIHEKTNGKSIKSVSLGHNNTKIIVCK